MIRNARISQLYDGTLIVGRILPIEKRSRVSVKPTRFYRTVWREMLWAVDATSFGVSPADDAGSVWQHAGFKVWLKCCFSHNRCVVYSPRRTPGPRTDCEEVLASIVLAWSIMWVIQKRRCSGESWRESLECRESIGHFTSGVLLIFTNMELLCKLIWFWPTESEYLVMILVECKM